ncbi:MAG: hypothetical protein JNM63_03690 [Spirochaetia bacterium]|nr:hypothetical protein [Spirochaetia bacterium]
MARIKGGFIWVLGLSLLLHGVGFLVATSSFSPLLNNLSNLDSLKKKQENSINNQILLDLSDEEEDREREKYNTFVSSKNIRAKGGKNNLLGLNALGSEQNLKGEVERMNSRAAEGKNIEQTDSKDGTIKLPAIGSKLQKQDDKEDPHFSLISEPSYTVRLRLDDSKTELKVGSESYEYAEFIQNFGQAFFKPFVQYARSTAWNAELMKSESITVLASVDRNGKISFEKNLVVSRTQPFLNYMAERSLEMAERLTRVPGKVFPPGENHIEIPLVITFTENPPVWSLSIPKL